MGQFLFLYRQNEAAFKIVQTVAKTNTIQASGDKGQFLKIDPLKKTTELSEEDIKVNTIKLVKFYISRMGQLMRGEQAKFLENWVLKQA